MSASNNDNQEAGCFGQAIALLILMTVLLVITWMVGYFTNENPPTEAGSSSYFDHIETSVWIVSSIVSLVGLVGLALLVDALRKQRNERREKERLVRDARYRLLTESADSLIEKLEAKYAPPAPPEPMDAGLRRRWEKAKAELATLKKVQQQIPVDVSDDRKGTAVMQTQQRIVELEDIVSRGEAMEQAAAKPPSTLARRIVFDKALSEQPTNFALFNKRAWFLQSEGQLDDALADVRRSLELWPGYADALNTLGVILKKQGDFEGAIREYRNAIEAAPKSPAQRTNLARLYNEMGRHQDALTVANEAIHLWNTSNRSAYVQTAIAYAELGELEYAVRDYTAAIEGDPKKYNYLKEDRAMVHHRLGNLESARVDLYQSMNIKGHRLRRSSLDLLIELEPRIPNHYHDRAFLQTNRRDKAADFYRAASLYQDSAPGPDFGRCVIELLNLQQRTTPDGFEFEDDALPFDEAIELGLAAFTVAQTVNAELAADVLAATRKYARYASEFDHATSISLKRVELAKSQADTPTLTVASATKELAVDLRDAGRIDKAMQAAFDAMDADIDSQHEQQVIGWVTRFFCDELLVNDDERVRVILDHLEDRVENDWSHQTESETLPTAHWHLARYYGLAQYPFFNQDKAKLHARHALDLKDDRLFAARYWAICELIEEGAGTIEIEARYADPLVVREIVAAGQKDCTNLASATI